MSCYGYGYWTDDSSDSQHSPAVAQHTAYFADGSDYGVPQPDNEPDGQWSDDDGGCDGWDHALQRQPSGRRWWGVDRSGGNQDVETEKMQLW